MNSKDEKHKEWSDRAAGLAVDALVDAGLISKEEFDSAAEIVAEELLVRLAIGDTPD
ncbi:MAG: hypothetical protein JSS77_09620 [Acidobacteria bacterium]|nr:hypothetical protein [Acidobacteriota bacterium]